MKETLHWQQTLEDITNVFIQPCVNFKFLNGNVSQFNVAKNAHKYFFKYTFHFKTIKNIIYALYEKYYIYENFIFNENVVCYHRSLYCLNK